MHFRIVSGAATVGSLSTSGAVNAGNITAGGNLITNNAIQGGSNGFLISPQGASSATGVLIFGDGRVRINSTSASTSTTTGAFAVSGGIGLTGDLYGANAVFSGTVTSLAWKLVRYAKVGAFVTVSAEFTWTSASGTLVEADANTSISTPFNSTLSRSMNVVIQKDSYVSTKMSFMDEASPILKTRVNAADMPGYTGGATLLFSWIFYA